MIPQAPASGAHAPAAEGAVIFVQPGAAPGHDLTGAVEIERLHRYAFARSYCRGRDVLDVGCGTGHGAAVLAQAARSVTGVDRDRLAVAQAQRQFAHRSLAFATGDAAALPLPDGSVDAVVAFGTVEHLDGHDAFLDEVRRVLRPGGLLIASTPDRDFAVVPATGPGMPSGAPHMRELNRAGFTALLARHFAYAAVALQRPLLGSVLVPDGDAAPAMPLVFERRGDDMLRVTAGLTRAVHVVGIASDRPVAPLASLYIGSSDLDAPAARVQDARMAARAAQAETRRLTHDLDARSAELAATATMRDSLQAALASREEQHRQSEEQHRQSEEQRRQTDVALARSETLL